jgi:L-rhamnose isomerase
VWDEYCAQCGVPAGFDWLEPMKKYEADVLCKR